MNKWHTAVRCPANGCGKVLSRRNNLTTHLENRHKWGHGEALRGTRDAALAEALPAVVAPAPAKQERKGSVDFTAIDPTDIAVGVIESQAGSTIPVVMLAEIVAYVDHTRRVVEQLRALR